MKYIDLYVCDDYAVVTYTLYGKLQQVRIPASIIVKKNKKKER